MGCICDILELETPDSILRKDNVDVFEEIIPNTDYDYLDKRAELWNKYRYRGIASCDRDYWIQCMKDVYSIIKETWDIKIKAWKQYQTSIISSIDFSESSQTYTNVIEREDTPDSPAGTTRYLSDRTTNTYDGRSYTGLEADTVRKYINAVPDPWDAFANEFRRLFYWGA